MDRTQRTKGGARKESAKGAGRSAPVLDPGLERLQSRHHPRPVEGGRIRGWLPCFERSALPAQVSTTAIRQPTRHALHRDQRSRGSNRAEPTACSVREVRASRDQANARTSLAYFRTGK